MRTVRAKVLESFRFEGKRLEVGDVVELPERYAETQRQVGRIQVVEQLDRPTRGETAEAPAEPETAEAPRPRARGARRRG